MLVNTAYPCDKFRYWHYAWKQSCNQRQIYLAHHIRPIAKQAAKPPSPPSPFTLDELAKLKAAMEAAKP